MLHHHHRLVLLCAAVALAPIATRAQTTTLTPLTIIGAEGTLNEAALPLGKCQGDCNRNIDCDANLMCFSRGGATTIPGCSGRAELDGTDYCWDPTDRPLPGIIAHVGNNGNPAVLFPLPRCAGQCTSDADCQSGLVCLMREKINDPVYGCDGPLLDRINYCVNPGDIPGSTTGTPTPNAGTGGSVAGTTTATTTTTPATTTTTITTTDSDAADADTSDAADTPDTTVVDGGVGVDAPDGEDEDIEPLMGVLTIMYLGGAAEPDEAQPLAECHGHCGLDVPCAEGLTCFNTTTMAEAGVNVTVPGCGGILLPNVHYCVKDVNANPLDDIELLNHPSLVGKATVVFLDGAPYDSLPLQHCQGDCQSHDMCQQPEPSESESDGTNETSTNSSTTTTTTGAPVGERMSCYIPDEDDAGVVPGCTGSALPEIGYCVKTADLAVKPTPSSPSKSSAQKPLTTIISFWWTLSAILPTLAAASAMVCVE